MFDSCKPSKNSPPLQEDMAQNRNRIAETIENSLRKNTLDKWYPMAYDTLHNGFITTFSYDWKPFGEENKMIVTQARHTWVNSKAAERYPKDDYFLRGAASGFLFLKDKMWDHTYGGFYTWVDRLGTNVIDTVKNAYGNAFAIYALAAYYHASGDTAALDLAKKAFLWLEKHSHDPAAKGYFQHLNRKGVPLVRNKKTNSRAETGYKDQNSSIHLLEAFTELYHVWPDPLVKERLTEMLYLIRDVMVTKRGYLTLFFTPDWKPVSFQDSARTVIDHHHNLDHVSFGHDVETAYLMVEATETLGNKKDTATWRIAKRMIDHALVNGWDASVGGFYDEGYYFKNDPHLTITKNSKNWWAQAEGLNTLLMMADRYPQDANEYYKKFQFQWKYIDEYLLDHEFGDWYAGGIDKEPFQKTAPKGHAWKACYHHFRSMANCVDHLRNP